MKHRQLVADISERHAIFKHFGALDGQHIAK